MSDLAIKVENLSKLYKIGARQERYKTLRDTITDALTTPLRKLKQRAKSKEQKEFSQLSALSTPLPAKGSALSALSSQLNSKLSAPSPSLCAGSSSPFASDSSSLSAPGSSISVSNSMPHAPCSMQAPDGHIWALRDVSFSVNHGEVVGIIGRNGAGKTTLLKILSRITEPTEGRAEIHGRVGSLLEVGTGFHPELTGRENIYLNGAILGMRKVEIERKFDEIVAFAEVEKFIDTPVKHYSSGMYVRLAFAVAAYLEPEILLVDEVLAVGDAAFQKKCLGKMEDLTRERRTVLFVSHNMAAVEQLCSRTMLLSSGYVEKLGSVESVIELYLSDAEWQRKKPAPMLGASSDGRLELLRAVPVDEKGHPLAVIQCGRDVYLSLQLRTAIQFPHVTVSIGLNNLYDVRVTVLHSEIAGFDLSLSAGENSVVCRVPHFPLPPGNYVLDVKIYSGHEVVLWAPHVEQLVVEAGDFYNTGRLSEASWGGYCYLDQHWEIRNAQ